MGKTERTNTMLKLNAFMLETLIDLFFIRHGIDIRKRPADEIREYLLNNKKIEKKYMKRFLDEIISEYKIAYPLIKDEAIKTLSESFKRFLKDYK